jgi:hypothetical protein
MLIACSGVKSRLVQITDSKGRRHHTPKRLYLQVRLFKRHEKHFFKYRWKLLDHIDQKFSRHTLPQHTVVISGGNTCLLIEALTGTGSGYTHSDTRLFKIGGDGVKELLSYPSQGVQCCRCHTPVQVLNPDLSISISAMG